MTITQEKLDKINDHMIEVKNLEAGGFFSSAYAEIGMVLDLIYNISDSVLSALDDSIELEK